MNVAIMQPYFFPYIGYLQLMASVDVFVFLDDVQYIDRGWVNRNRIRLGSRAQWLGCAVRAAPRTNAINEREYLLSDGRYGASNIIARLQACYARAPHYDATMALVSEILEFSCANVAAFNENLLCRISAVLGLGCKFYRSADVLLPVGVRGQERIIAISQRLDASCYVNPIGGQALYRAPDFALAEIGLKFLRTRISPACLESGNEHLSILDWFMLYGVEGTCSRLFEFDLEAA